MKNYSELHEEYIRANLEINKIEALLSSGVHNVTISNANTEVKIPAIGEVGTTVVKMLEFILERLKAKRHSLLEHMINKA